MSALFKSLILIRGDQEILCKLIRLAFFIITIRLSTTFPFGFNKDISFPMEKNVACFMKKSEPKMIIGFTTEAKLY